MFVRVLLRRAMIWRSLLLVFLFGLILALTPTPTTRAATIQFDVTPVLTADGILNYSGTLDTTQSSIDATNHIFMTQSGAQNHPANPPDPDGLPDDGYFAANGFHPEVQLAYRNTDNGNNVRLVTGAGNFTFNVPATSYDEVHIFASSTEGSSSVRLTFRYADNSTTTTAAMTVPDWFNSIGQTANTYYLIDGMDRSGQPPSGGNYENANTVAAFGLRFLPDPNKVLQQITVEKTTASGWLVFFGALGNSTTEVSDFVWEDLDQDGIQDGGENGINGLTVSLYQDVDNDGLPEPNGDDGSPYATTVTINNGIRDGYYQFQNMPPEDYFLEFELPTGFTFSPQDQGGNDTLDSDANPTTGLTDIFAVIGADTTRDAGLYGNAIATIGDFVWSDNSADGIQDGGENGINGVTVRLYQDSGDSIPNPANDYLIDSTTTVNNGTDGYYQFDQLAEDNAYFVQIVPPSNHSFTLQDQGGDDTLDSDVNPATGLTAIFSLGQAQNDGTRDAGLLGPATVGNYVWQDSNGNHLQDGGENGINGITVRIYRDNGDGIPVPGTDTLVGTTTTANDGSNNGAYQFVVPADDYFIEFVPGTRLLALPDRGGDDTLDSDPDPTTGLTPVFTVGPGATNLTVDAGMSASSSCNVAVVGTGTTTSNEGYDLTVNQLNDDTFYNFTATRVNPTDVDSAAELSAYDAVVIGWTFEANNYTIYQSALRAWVEGGGGVVGLGFLDWSVPAATDIDAIIPINMAGAGQYVSSGSVIVITAHPVTQGVANFTATGCFVEYPAGASPYLDIGATGLATTNAIPSVAVIEPVDGRAAYLGPAYSYNGCGAGPMRTGDGDHLLENAVAWAGSCGTPTLGDYVWLDDDQDGVQDGTETGLNNVTVNLYRDADYDAIPEPGGDDGAPIQTTVTSNNGTGDGFYQFTPALGYYFLEFVPSSNMSFSPQDQGADDTLDSDVNPANGLTEVFTFSAADVTKDAGFIPGVVWDGEGADNNWSTAANWVGDVVPTATDRVVFNTTSIKNAVVDAGFAGTVSSILVESGYTGVITMQRALQVSDNYRQYGGTFVVANPSIALLSVGGTLIHDGGILQQSQTVGVGSAVHLLQIEDGSSNIKYRGVDLTTDALTDLGLVTVAIEAIDLASGQYCTNTGGISPTYADRCFTITPANNGPALVRLWALTSELNGIPQANLSVYRSSSGWTELLTNRAAGNDGGAYSYAEGSTPGFSDFLLGQTGISPTAITVQSLYRSLNQPVLALLVMALLCLATGLLLFKQRRT